VAAVQLRVLLRRWAEGPQGQGQGQGQVRATVLHKQYVYFLPCYIFVTCALSSCATAGPGQKPALVRRLHPAHQRRRPKLHRPSQRRPSVPRPDGCSGTPGPDPRPRVRPTGPGPDPLPRVGPGPEPIRHPRVRPNPRLRPRPEPIRPRVRPRIRHPRVRPNPRLRPRPERSQIQPRVRPRPQPHPRR